MWNVILPLETDTYQQYIDKLSLERVFGYSNKPEDIYTECHHIIPKSLNGNNSINNIIVILPEEHYYCHKLLALENPQNKALQFAWWMMCHKMDGDTKRYYKVPPEEYSEAQKRTAALSSEMNSIPIVDVSDVENKLKINKRHVRLVCRGIRKTAGGHRFAYYEDYLKGNYTIKSFGHEGRIVQDIDTGIVYKTAAEAGKALGLDPSSILKVCKGQYNNTKGHVFIFYSNDDINNIKNNNCNNN